jgi:hypothetical protein
MEANACISDPGSIFRIITYGTHNFTDNKEVINQFPDGQGLSFKFAQNILSNSFSPLSLEYNWYLYSRTIASKFLISISQGTFFRAQTIMDVK